MTTAILFDLDETLFDRRGSLRLFLADQLGRLFPDVSAEVDTTIERFIDLDNRGRTPKDKVYATILSELGHDDPALCAALFAHYEANAWRFAQGFDGMVEILADIKALGWKTGIVNNGQTYIQMRSLLALNLDRLVDVSLISETIGLRKPDPRIFKRAARELKVRLGECIFVGDNPEADIVGAQNAGMQTVWFPNGAHWPAYLEQQPNATIHALWDLMRVLHQLSPES